MAKLSSENNSVLSLPDNRADEVGDGKDSQFRQVFCQSDEIAAVLTGLEPSWNVSRFALNDHPVNSGAVVVAENEEVFTSSLRAAIESAQVRVIYLLSVSRAMPAPANRKALYGILTVPIDSHALKSLIDGAFENLALAGRQFRLERELERAQREIDQLNEIGVALSTQRDRQALLHLILRQCREITNSDAGSLYLVEGDELGERCLRFTITQNDSVDFEFTETILPIDNSSLAGYVALTGEEVHLENVYELPASLPFRFNRQFDEQSGYLSRSMLVVPMKNPQGEITGVVQLINCKRATSGNGDGTKASHMIVPFPEQCRSFLSSFASQAAVAIENNRLYESIENLFEGFVRASVSAIEARDPATSGHSFRVADLTVGLAQAVDRADSPAFRAVRFSRTEMKEIRYASLLHDFGKVGVREEVLVKAKKLYPRQLELIKQRFLFARKSLEHDQSERKLAYLLEKGREEFLARQADFHRELESELVELDRFLEFILFCNEPTVLCEGNFDRLAEMASRQFTDGAGQQWPLLGPQEIQTLSIHQGSLDEWERRQIESHVNYTLSFLRQIPWTKEIKNIPMIASAHHEKLDGTGYPQGLAAAQIPLPSKMMTIADIFDALSATDRPYKKAMRWDNALDILHDEARRGLIDHELLTLFREAEIFRLVANYKSP